MFDNYEPLICDICKKEFTGRKPADECGILCPECTAADTSPLINDGDTIPDSVNEETAGGRGNDDEK